MIRESRDKTDASKTAGTKARPEEWIPLLLDIYEDLTLLLKDYRATPVVAGAGAYALHVEADPTKDIDITLSRPLTIDRLASLMSSLRRVLEERGYSVVGARIQQGRGTDDWVIQLLVSVSPGRIVGVEVFNLLSVRPLALYEVEEVIAYGKRLKALTLESWFASKLADPNGIDEHNLHRLESAVDKGIDKDKLFELLQRLSMTETIKTNAMDALKRTKHPRLRSLLSALI